MMDIANQVAKIVYAKDTDIESEKHAKRMAQEFADYAAHLTKEKKYSEIEAEGCSLRQAGVSFHLLNKYFNFYGYTVYVAPPPPEALPVSKTQTCQLGNICHAQKKKRADRS